MGVLVGRMILHGTRIKDDYVRKITLAKHAATFKRKILGRHRAQLADSLLKRNGTKENNRMTLGIVIPQKRIY